MVDLEGFEIENGLRPDAAIQKPYDIKDLTLKIRHLMKHMLHFLPNFGDISTSFINYSKITCFIIALTIQ